MSPARRIATGAHGAGRVKPKQPNFAAHGLHFYLAHVIYFLPDLFTQNSVALD